jgi:glycosyltransferase involved in cell wall biosynthesis
MNENAYLYDTVCYCKRIDIVYSFYPPFDDMKYPCKKIFTIYDLTPYLHPEVDDQVSFYDNAIRKSAIVADKIITSSEYTKKDVVKYFGISHDKINVVHLMAPKSVHSEYVDDGLLCKWKLDEPYILYVGALAPHKNLERLMEAFCLLKKRRSTDRTKLVMTGPSVLRYDFIRKVTEICGDREDIIITGYVSDRELATLYHNAIAVAYVSLYEGFGMPVLEALSLGKVVLCSDATSLPEIGGDAVVYCNPYEIESIESGLRSVLYDEYVRKICQQKALVQASKFSADKSAKKLMNVIENLLYS